MKAISFVRWVAAAAAACVFLAAAVPAGAQEKAFKPYTEAIDADCPNCGWSTTEQKSNGLPSKNPIVPFKQGETCPICSGKGKLMAQIDWQNGFYLVEGFGVPPEDMVREYVATKSKNVLKKMRVAAMRAARVDCIRNAVALAAKVRLDGDRLLGDMATELQGHAEMMEEVGDGDWVEENVSYPFFKMNMRVPLWGAEGVIGVFYNKVSDSNRKAREKKKPFDWREAMKSYEKNPKEWERAGLPAQPPVKPETPPPTTPDNPPPATPPTTPDNPPPATPPTTPDNPPPATPPTTPENPPPATPPTTPENPPAQPVVPAKPEEATPAKPTGDEEFQKKEAGEVEEVIIDARGLQEEGGLSPALFPKVEFVDKDGNKQTVYDLSEVEDGPAKNNGMVQYVNSNTPFEKISRLAGPRTLVLRASELREGSVRLAGIRLPVCFQEGVDFTGPKGEQKKKVEYKFKAVHVSGVTNANIVITARDALELKKTDEAAKVLSKCKVIIIAGGDIAGKEGSLEGESFAKK
ncbi:MAG: hypothetical protein MUC63_09000 [Planctomycetes bacterium]|nr:hypothetical protein [Planctomycetota bacterium]